MRIKPARMIGSLAAIAIVLSACGTTEETSEESDRSGEDITVVDGAGNEVTLEGGPAERVVTLEWAQTEAVVSLGVDPVGVADPDGYQSWVGEVVPLRDEPTNVGVRREPSTDAIVDLEPDLILGVEGSIPESELEHLERAAPVVLFKGADAEDPIGHATEDFETIATLLGKDAEAESLIEEFNTTLDDNAAAIADAGLEGKPVVLASPFMNGSTLEIRMHGPRTAPQQIAERLGLGDAWTDPGDDEYGLSSTDLEGLTGLPDDAAFLYWGNDDEEADLVETTFAQNAVWQSLPLVQNDDVYRAGVGIWVYGGPASLAAWSDDLVAQLTE